MLRLPEGGRGRGRRIYVAAEPTNLRRGFDGLTAATRSVIRQDPLNGHLVPQQSAQPDQGYFTKGPPATSLVQVVRLVRPELMIEVDVVAAADIHD